MNPVRPTLVDWLDVHRGEEAWIFGKGPSFDAFDMVNAGPIRCAINDVVAHLPACKYAFAVDRIDRWADMYPSTVTLFRPWDSLANHPARLTCKTVPMPKEVVGISEERLRNLDELSRMTWPRPCRQSLAIGFVGLPGTLGSAVQVLAVMGVKTVHCVGIDGGERYASPAFRIRTPNNSRMYDMIRTAFVWAARELDMRVTFAAPLH